MHGIFLHILADALGSLSVVVSTLLVQYTSWTGFDPLASMFIAILIFASAVPLVISSASTLLLTIPDDTEYQLRDKIAGVSAIPGVQGYCEPRFWLEDAKHEETIEGDRKSKEDDDTDDCSSSGGRILGVMHIQVTQGVDEQTVRERVKKHLGLGMDIVCQVEKMGDSGCWCSGSQPPSAGLTNGLTKTG